MALGRGTFPQATGTADVPREIDIETVKVYGSTYWIRRGGTCMEDDVTARRIHSNTKVAERKQHTPRKGVTATYQGKQSIAPPTSRMTLQGRIARGTARRCPLVVYGGPTQNEAAVLLSISHVNITAPSTAKYGRSSSCVVSVFYRQITGNSNCARPHLQGIARRIVVIRIHLFLQHSCKLCVHAERWRGVDARPVLTAEPPLYILWHQGEKASGTKLLGLCLDKQEKGGP